MQKSSVEISKVLTSYITEDITPVLLHIVLYFMGRPVWSIKIKENEENLDEYFSVIDGWKWSIGNIYNFWFALLYIYYYYFIDKKQIFLQIYFYFLYN